MFQSDQVGITIPTNVLEELAEAVAVKVIARLRPQIEQLSQVQQAPVPFEEPHFRPTFLKISEVAQRIGCSRGNIYKKMSEGKFPQSVKLGERSVAWRLDDIESWERDPLGFSCK